MKEISKFTRRPNGASNLLEKQLPNPLKNQPCIKAIKNAKIHPKLKKEISAFAKRNTLSDCGRVPPNCLKAHMIKTARNLKLSDKKVESLKKLFRSKIGYNGYYLDAGKLKKV